MLHMPLHPESRRQGRHQPGDSVLQHTQHLLVGGVLNRPEAKLAIQRQDSRVHSRALAPSTQILEEARDRDRSDPTNGFAICANIEFQLRVGLLLVRDQLD